MTTLFPILFWLEIQFSYPRCLLCSGNLLVGHTILNDRSDQGLDVPIDVNHSMQHGVSCSSISSVWNLVITILIHSLIRGVIPLLSYFIFYHLNHFFNFIGNPWSLVFHQLDSFFLGFGELFSTFMTNRVSTSF